MKMNNYILIKSNTIFLYKTTSKDLLSKVRK